MELDGIGAQKSGNSIRLKSYAGRQYSNITGKVVN